MIDINRIKALYEKRSKAIASMMKQEAYRIVLYANGKASSAVSEKYKEDIILIYPYRIIIIHGKRGYCFVMIAGMLIACIRGRCCWRSCAAKLG